MYIKTNLVDLSQPTFKYKSSFFLVKSQCSNTAYCLDPDSDARKAEPCPNQLSRIVQRPWGIADLKFFSHSVLLGKLIRDPT